MERTQWIDVCFFPITCETVTTICLCELTFTLWNLQSTLKPSKKSRIKKKKCFSDIYTNNNYFESFSPPKYRIICNRYKNENK